jgi:hypothetical protein
MKTTMAVQRMVAKQIFLIRPSNGIFLQLFDFREPVLGGSSTRRLNAPLSPKRNLAAGWEIFIHQSTSPKAPMKIHSLRSVYIGRSQLI